VYLRNEHGFSAADWGLFCPQSWDGAPLTQVACLPGSRLLAASLKDRRGDVKPE
jgi:hypothetical protein